MPGETRGDWPTADPDRDHQPKDHEEDGEWHEDERSTEGLEHDSHENSHRRQYSALDSFCEIRNPINDHTMAPISSRRPIGDCSSCSR